MTYRTIEGLEVVPLSAVIEFANDEYAKREKDLALTQTTLQVDTNKETEEEEEEKNKT